MNMSSANTSSARLAGKIALVTGAAGGIGRETCLRLIAEGASVYAADLRLPDFPPAEGPGPIGLLLDVTSTESWAAVMKRIKADHERLDILVNNAGIYAPALIESETPEGFRRMSDINQFGVFWGMKSAAALMGDGGAIVNLSSIGGMVGYRGTFSYTASKWAVRGMSRSAAREFAPRGIRVNTISPGVIDTPMFHENDLAQAGAFIASVPLGKLGQPRDIADAVVYLASDEARYVTGAELLVDGGILA
ncbi:SDR family oxidoreductase [Xinfangfangia sp. D13-10-4-6]|uniref:SDR family NAD(P)-dependent oxidoreductase n=1 Tax=Pseudogemmobacter hezensis TaxID=2737662 RepID=UPI001552C4A2|nr:SDR family oxidoreductase [Pseudogemmobacter hezensis]NPD14890.1 SDR family oxidoreductase [Pseudogemmobacter hezensis]